MTKTKLRLSALLRARRADELEDRRQRTIYLLWNAAALLLSSLGIAVLSLALAIGTYDVEEFFGYFTHPVLLLLNWLPILLLQLLFFCLFGRHWAAFLATAVLIFLPSAGDFYKIKFRFEPFTFEDMDSVAAGLRVAGDYPLSLNSRVLACLLVTVLGTAALLLAARHRPGRVQRLATGLLALLSAVPLWFGVYADEALYQKVSAQNAYIGNLTEQQTFINAGFVYPFLHSIETSRPQPPEGYEPETAAAALARYEDADIPADRAVNVMVLQLESFTDLETMGFSGVAPGVYDVLHRLQEESISGTMVANVLGGGTIRTERCLLTGSYEMPRITAPCSSYVRYFNEQGYFTTGSHPNRPDFYNRVNVADYLGFAEYLFSSNHYEELTDGRWNCDDVFLPEVFRLFRQHTAAGERVFSFNVSLQGHGPYTSDEVNYTGSFWADDSVSPETADTLNSYLALAAETQDLLLEQLEALRADPQPAVLLIYGDHPPAFASQVYDECGVSFSLDREEDFLRYFGTPYLIWANDAAKAQLGGDFTGEGPTVSPCYLMNLLFEALGWKGSAYLQYVGDKLDRLPLISTNGAYLEDGVFTASLSPEGEALLREYAWVQYYEHMLPVEASTPAGKS